MYKKRYRDHEGTKSSSVHLHKHCSAEDPSEGRKINKINITKNFTSLESRIDLTSNTRLEKECQFMKFKSKEVNKAPSSASSSVHTTAKTPYLSIYACTLRQRQVVTTTYNNMQTCPTKCLLSLLCSTMLTYLAVTTAINVRLNLVVFEGCKFASIQVVQNDSGS